MNLTFLITNNVLYAGWSLIVFFVGVVLLLFLAPCLDMMLRDVSGDFEV